MTVIVPVDFSVQSINAVSFASKMLAGVCDADLVLYHLYFDESEEKDVINSLQKIKEALPESSFVKIRCLAEKGNGLVYSLTRLINKEDASLVVMSVSDRVKFFEDSYSLQLMAQSACPVMVVPYGYFYNEVRTIAVASDFKDVDKTIPLGKVKKVLDIFRPRLHIVHVTPEPNLPLNEKLQARRNQLAEMFNEYCPEFHFITAGNFGEGLDRFINDKSVDLVLTFPRKHSYLSTLMKGTNTQKLVYKNAVPVLAAHD